MAATFADYSPEIIGANNPPLTKVRIGSGSCLRIAKALTLLLLLSACISTVRPVLAQGSGTESVEISARAGYDSYYKGEFWTPVQVEVANNGPGVQGHLEIVLGGGGGSGEVIYRSPISLPMQSNKRQTLYVFVPSFATALTVELIDDAGRTVASTLTNTLSRLATDSLLYGVVTEDPGRLEYLEDVTGGRIVDS